MGAASGAARKLRGTFGVAVVRFGNARRAVSRRKNRVSRFQNRRNRRVFRRAFAAASGSRRGQQQRRTRRNDLRVAAVLDGARLEKRRFAPRGAVHRNFGGTGTLRQNHNARRLVRGADGAALFDAARRKRILNRRKTGHAKRFCHRRAAVVRFGAAAFAAKSVSLRRPARLRAIFGGGQGRIARNISIRAGRNSDF